MADDRFDPLSFLTGVLALVGAGLVLLARSDVVEVDEAVVAAALLLAGGLVGAVRAVLRLRSGRG